MPMLLLGLLPQPKGDCDTMNQPLSTIKCGHIIYSSTKTTAIKQLLAVSSYCFKPPVVFNRTWSGKTLERQAASWSVRSWDPLSLTWSIWIEHLTDLIVHNMNLWIFIQVDSRDCMFLIKKHEFHSPVNLQLWIWYNQVLSIFLEPFKRWNWLSFRTTKGCCGYKKLCLQLCFLLGSTDVHFMNHSMIGWFLEQSHWSFNPLAHCLYWFQDSSCPTWVDKRTHA